MTNPHPAAPRNLIFAAFASIYLIWGSTYLAILVALKTIPPFLLLGFRFAVAGAILFAWRAALGERAGRVGLRRHAVAGILMLFGGTGAVVWVEQYIPSGMAAIIVAGVPFWFVLLDYRQWSFNFSNGLILSGILVGFAGILYLFSLKGDAGPVHTDVSRFAAMSVLILGCISWAGGSLYLKYQPGSLSTTMGAGVQMLAAGVFSLVVGWQQGEWNRFSIHTISPESWAGLLYLITFGSLIGYLSYVWLLGRRPAVQVGTYAYVNPAVALLLGWLMAAEPLGLPQLIALSVILTGVLLINLPKYKGLFVRVRERTN